jgi:hypothetical protein
MALRAQWSEYAKAHGAKEQSLRPDSAFLRSEFKEAQNFLAFLAWQFGKCRSWFDGSYDLLNGSRRRYQKLQKITTGSGPPDPNEAQLASRHIQTTTANSAIPISWCQIALCGSRGLSLKASLICASESSQWPRPHSARAITEPRNLTPRCQATWSQRDRRT